jgi:predicted SAM-dependent methyltransferase
MGMKRFLQKRLSRRTYEHLRALVYDVKRFKTRIWQRKKLYSPPSPFIQLGAGARTMSGWVNVDLTGADVNLDFTYGKLPWKNDSVESIVSQHVIEHLKLEDELIPLFREIYRVLRVGGQLWLSTPDMEKICRSYLDHHCLDLYEDRQRRMPEWSLGNIPSQHMMNDFFHQNGEHQNLFDFELLKWALMQAGFQNIQRTNEKNLLDQFPGFPARNDDVQSLYVRTVKE